MSWVATTKGIDAALIGDLMMQGVEIRFGYNGRPSKPKILDQRNIKLIESNNENTVYQYFSRHIIVLNFYLRVM
jgi:hypothetical protein